MNGYLTQLTMLLAAGALQLPEEDRAKHGDFLRGLQGDDGGFPGREGPSDAYYTGFALRALALLGRLDEETARRAAVFVGELAKCESLSSVDFMSAVQCDVLLDMTYELAPFASVGVNVAEEADRRLSAFRRDDGGYAKTPRSGASSTYHTFLAIACRQLVELSEPSSEQVSELLCGRQREDGGFVELDQLRQSGTNPTAAAIGALRLLDALDEDVARRAGEFLLSMQMPDGGLRANTRIPIGDLLSTFTGLVALHDVGAIESVKASSVAAFAHQLACPNGGFRGGVWDATPDAEYTFYGVGTLALLKSSS